MNDGTDRRELFLASGTGSYVLRYIIDKQTVVIIELGTAKSNATKTKK